MRAINPDLGVAHSQELRVLSGWLHELMRSRWSGRIKLTFVHNGNPFPSRRAILAHRKRSQQNERNQKLSLTTAPRSVSEEGDSSSLTLRGGVAGKRRPPLLATRWLLGQAIQRLSQLGLLS